MARQRDDEQVTTRRMGIGSRLLLLLAIPLTALLVVTGYGVYVGATRSAAASELAGRTELALASYALVEDLQAERAELVADDRTTPELRDAVQRSTDELVRSAGQVGGRLQLQTQDALESVATSSEIADRGLGGAVALRVYSDAVAQLLDLSSTAIDPQGAIDDAAASVTDYLARAQAAAAEERDLVTVLVADDTLDSQSFQEVMSLASAQRSYVDLAAAASPPALAIRIRQVGFASSAADAVRRSVFAGNPTGAGAWIEGLDQRTTELAGLQRTAEQRTVAAVDRLASNSRLLLVTAALAAIAIVLISALLLRRAVRSIARPLQELSTQAEDVARVRLPEAVATQQLDGVEAVHLPALRATGAREVHEVAGAFNEVQDTALRLASEQAALRRNQAEALTNLGRRNQTLLARQLDFISSLETRETDPAFLDHLFKLDHLASRMRRNAESLLILAGSETPRRRRTPAPISEIVRAAMSEVEEFERVRIGNVRDATVTGPAVIDLIHLLAELLENALGFSPPDTTVEIDGRSLGQGGYQFAIIDHGVGMTDVELVAANQRLRGLDELKGMPTRYLGQYVVAKLAAKTGALVRLQPSTGGRGVTALVILPTSALVGERDRDAVAQPLPGSRAAREQGPVPFAPGVGVAPAVDPDGGAVFADAALSDTSFSDTSFPDTSFPDTSFPDTSFPDTSFDEVAPAEPVTAEPSSSWTTEPAPEIVEATAFDSTAFEAASFDSTAFDSTEVDSTGVDSTALEATEVEHTPVAPAADPFAVVLPEASQDQPTTEVPAAGDVAEDLTADATGGADVVWFGSPQEPAPGTDPWQDFLADEPSPAEAVEAPLPPPAPPVAPVQPGWVPAAPSETLTAAASMATSAEPRAGGLARRVPGASLAESRGNDLGAPAAPAAGRSADGVRSMLSAFQAGRQRGLEPGADDTVPSTHDSAHDGRFPQ